MTASRAEPRSRRLLWGVIVAVLASGVPNSGLFAQAPAPSKPFNLQPPTRLEPPATGTPGTGSSQSTTTRPDNAGTTPGSSVKVGALRDVRSDSAGTLSESNGGFPASLWHGTSRSVIDALLPALPVEAPSPTMHQLARRLLLSTAEIPAGESTTSLLAVRADLLARMGEFSSLAELLDLARDQAGNDKLARLQLDSRLTEFDMQRACKLAAAPPAAGGDIYWQQTLIFCQALAGQKDQAALGVALLRERKLDDPVFFELMDDISGLGDAKLTKLTKPSALTLAMARGAQAALPPDLLNAATPALMRFGAFNPNVDAKVRLAAAERAEAAGILSSDALRDIYAKVEFTKEQRANPLSAAEADAGPVGRALLYRTAVEQRVAAARAETLSQALRLAQKADRYPTIARVFAPLVAALQPAPDLAWFAPEAARALLVAGTAENAGAWLALTRSGALLDAEKQKRFYSLLPLARLVGVAEAKTWDPDLNAWFKAVPDKAKGNEQAVLLYMLLEALGDGVSDSAWADLLQPAERAPVDMPPAAVWYRLEQASADGRMGETVALALIVLGNDGTQQASPIVLRSAIKALLHVGEEKAARALAVEAAVAAGL